MYKSKKYSVIIVTLMLSIFIVLSGCTDSSNNSNNSNSQESLSTVEKIKQNGKLVLGTCADYPPYEFHKEINGKDEIVGFDISIAKEIAKELGVELEIKDMRFEGLLPALKTGKIDLIVAGMTPTEEREKEVDFSKIYYTALQGVIVRAKDKDKIQTLDDLNGKTIGVQKASIQESIAKEQIQGANQKGLGKVSDLILNLKNKKVDAVIIEAVVGEAYVNNNSDLYMTNITLRDDEGGSAVAVTEGNTELLNIVNQTIDKLIENNSIEKFVIEATQMADNN